MAKRVFELAKELNVPSKQIVTKCHEEGIPDSVIKNHMSSVTAGLEASIRDWFGSGGGTAVETAPPVVAETREPSQTESGAENAGEAARAKAARPADPSQAAARAKPAAPARPQPRTIAAPGVARPVEAEPKPERPAAATPAPAPASRETPPTREPAHRDADNGTGTDRETSRAKAEPIEKPAARKPGDSEPPAQPQRPGRPEQSPSPARMNVPDRPQVVKPVGKPLEKKSPVKLSGPKVVRVEAPEPMQERPRRRPPAGGAPAFAGGRGVAPGPMEPAGDDRGKAGGRRNKRRGGPGEAGGGGGGGGGGGRGGRGSGRETGGWSDADLAEREARLQHSGGFLKQRRQQLRRQQAGGQIAQTPAQRGGKVAISAPFTIKDLSAATGVKGAEIVKKLFLQDGVMATINSGIDPEKAMEIMMEYDIELEVREQSGAEQAVEESFSEREAVDSRPRGPVVTILGHVDHGKTSLLDKIRNANVAAGEAGGITQATSAFRVGVKVGDETKQIVFLDTPGHEAFTAMRARGATVTDIVVLVVAADDGVMPQTIESINHAKAAGVPIVVALNKIDKPEATDTNIQRILGQLAEHELNPAEWGGETEVVRTSAQTGQGVDDLLVVLDLQAQLLELTADFGGAARGSVVESRFEQGRGAVANVLVQDGHLKVGDFIVAGRAFGRVRDITDDKGSKLKEASPPMPVQISGLDELPNAGDKFYIVDSLKKAEQAAQERRDREREAQLSQPKVTLDTMFSRMAEAELKEILVVLKADVQGSVDVLRHEIEKVSGDEIKVRVLHAAVGGITESDVLLAEASGAIIVGFNVIPSGKARRLADDKGVEIRSYRVIYDITDDIKKAAEGLLEPDVREEVLGHAEVRQVFRVSKVGAVAGCYVTDGMVARDALIRVTRNDIVIEQDRKLAQLKRFKDDAKEVRAGMECGMKIDGYDDIKEGDILECFRKVEVKRTL